MSYIDTLEEAAERALAASESAENSAQIMNDVANGNSTTTVDTANGPVDTVAKAIADIIAEIEGGVVTSNQERVTVEDDAQTTFSLNNTTTSGMALYIEGSREFSFTINSSSTFTISEPVPAGTQMYVVNRTIEGGIGGSIVQVTDGDKPLNTALTDIEDSVAAAVEAIGEGSGDSGGVDSNTSEYIMMGPDNGSDYIDYMFGPSTYQIYVGSDGASFNFMDPTATSPVVTNPAGLSDYPEGTFGVGTSYTCMIYLTLNNSSGFIEWDPNIQWIGGSEPEFERSNFPAVVNLITFSVTPYQTGMNSFGYRVVGSLSGIIDESAGGGAGGPLVVS